MTRKEKHFCTYLTDRYITPHARTAGAPVGFFSPRLAYIVRGRCEMKSADGCELVLQEGDVWFVPKAKPYVSNWFCDDYTDFFMIEFEADLLSLDYDAFQKLYLPNAKELFESFFIAYSRNETYKALSCFYAILHAVIPLLKKTENEHFTTVLPALRYVNENYTQTIPVQDLAALCSLSASRFYTVFKQAVGVSPIEYKNNIKLSRASELLRKGYTLERVCEELNFSSPAFLRRLMKKHLQKLPKDVKKEKTEL